MLEQVMKQLHKLIDVIKVIDLTQENHVERELGAHARERRAQHRAEILRTADIFRAKVVDVTPTTRSRSRPRGTRRSSPPSSSSCGPWASRSWSDREGRHRARVQDRAALPEELLGKPADAQRRCRDAEAGRDQRVTGFADQTARNRGDQTDASEDLLRPGRRPLASRKQDRHHRLREPGARPTR